MPAVASRLSPLAEWLWIFTGLGGPCVLAAVGMLVLAIGAYLYSRRLKRLTADRPAHCANCGYDLSQLDLARCPECGALRGFTVPLTDLGLTEAEIRAGFGKRRRDVTGPASAVDSSASPGHGSTDAREDGTGHAADHQT